MVQCVGKRRGVRSLRCDGSFLFSFLFFSDNGQLEVSKCRDEKGMHGRIGTAGDWVLCVPEVPENSQHQEIAGVMPGGFGYILDLHSSEGWDCEMG